jgi:hypothetical protein
MQPQTPAQGDIPAETTPIARVQVGMSVIDAVGTQVGTVAAVQPPGTDVRPDTLVGVAEHLMGSGYLRIDGTGFLSNDTYADGDQISTVDEGVVELRIAGDELHRSAS